MEHGRQLAWVTGAQGFLGRHVARALHSAGWRVVGIGLGDWGTEDPHDWGLGVWRADEITVAALKDFFGAVGRPDVVFHAAGSGSVGFSRQDPFTDFHSNVVTLAAVLETARTHAPNARVIYPSSAAVYGAAPKGPIAETAPLAPVSPYGSHKLLAERMCLAWSEHFGIGCAIIRFFSLYGRGLRKQLLWDVGRMISQNPTRVCLAGTGEERRDFLHVEDAAQLAALLASTTFDRPLVINGGTGESVSVREVAERVAALMGGRTAICFSRESRPGDPPYYQADTAQLERLHFRPHWSLDAGVRDYVAWLREADLARQ